MSTQSRSGRTSGPYHAGERAVHARLGVEWQADRVGGIIRSDMPPALQAFLRQQPFAVVASADPQGSAWASLLSGRPGFLEARDEHTLRIDAMPAPGDPLGANLERGTDLGMIAIDPATRRRVRLNGSVVGRDKGALLLRTRQVYGNCPKYIQARRMDPLALDAAARADVLRTGALTPPQRDWIAAADTFFIASRHPEAGADASHRGGMPRFVRVPDEGRLRFPDYPGNLMFNTLGNLVANPAVGLLFLDWGRGRTLQVTGTAAIDWDPASAAEFPGAERVVEVRIHAVVEIAGATPFRWTLLDYSPFNPSRPATGG